MQEHVRIITRSVYVVPRCAVHKGSNEDYLLLVAESYMCQFCSPQWGSRCLPLVSARLDITSLCSAYQSFSPCLCVPPQGRVRRRGTPVRAMIKSSIRMPTGSPDMRGETVWWEARRLSGVQRSRWERGRHTLFFFLLFKPEQRWVPQDRERYERGCRRGWKVWGMKAQQARCEKMRKREVKEWGKKKKGWQGKLGRADWDVRGEEGGEVPHWKGEWLETSSAACISNQ